MALDLRRCPFCGEKPTYIKTPDGFEIQCMNKLCLAKPIVGFWPKFLDHVKAAEAWNLQKLAFDIDDLRKGYCIIKRNELKKLFTDLLVTEEVWKKYLPETEYLEGLL